MLWQIKHNFFHRKKKNPNKTIEKMFVLKNLLVAKHML